MTSTLSQNQLTRAEGGLDIGGFVNSRGYRVYPFLVYIRLFHLPWLLGSRVAAQEKLDLEKGAAPSKFFETIFSREALVLYLRTIKYLHQVHLPVGNKIQHYPLFFRIADSKTKRQIGVKKKEKKVHKGQKPQGDEPTTTH